MFAKRTLFFAIATMYILMIHDTSIHSNKHPGSKAKSFDMGSCIFNVKNSCSMPICSFNVANRMLLCTFKNVTNSGPKCCFTVSNFQF